MRGGSGPQLQQSESRTMRGGSGPHLQQSESRTMREQWSAEELALVGVVDVIVVRSTNFVLGPHHFIFNSKTSASSLSCRSPFLIIARPFLDGREV